MQRPFRKALQYAIGLSLPILLGQVWPGPQVARPIAAYLFFLCIALVARFFGFGPAIVCTFASALTLWTIVLNTTTMTHPPSVQILRLALFLAAAIVVTLVSRQKTKEAIDAEKRLAALFDRALNAILFFDSTGRYIDANPAATKLLGMDCAEIKKHSIGDFSLPGRGQPDEQYERLIAHGSLTGEATIVVADGSTREVEYRSVADILPGLHLIIVHDISARKAAERSLRQLSGRLLQLQDEERSRIARQLHDTTAQSLAAVRLNLVRVSRSIGACDPALKDAVDESISLTEQSIAEVRTLSYLLHPPMIEEAGLLPSLRWYVRGFEERSGITTTLDAPETLARLPLDVETAIFRIVQEALTNVQRHSGSEAATVGIEREDGHMRVLVADSGRGLPLRLRGDSAALRSAGVGIAGIEERARELGGAMTVASSDGGTRVEVMLPVAES